MQMAAHLQTVSPATVAERSLLAGRSLRSGLYWAAGAAGRAQRALRAAAAAPRRPSWSACSLTCSSASAASRCVPMPGPALLHAWHVQYHHGCTGDPPHFPCSRLEATLS